MPIIFIDPQNGQPLLLTEAGLKKENQVVYPYQKGAVRLVRDPNYTESFGYQWNKFRETQVDKASQLDISRDRFFAETGWDKEDLSGKNVLEVGSGAGRFTQVLLDHTNANIYSIDYSNAVEANYKNNGPSPRLHLFQASVYEMPFQKHQFDKVICIGVLQHTPDFKKSVQCLADMVKPGGELVVDFYPINGWWTKIHAKYLMRPFTRHMDHTRLFSMIDRNAGFLIKFYRFLSSIGLKFFTRFLPVCDIDGTLPKGLPPEKLKEMVVLDTFDMFSPRFDNPQRIRTVVKWFEDAGLTSVWGGTIKYQGFRAAVVKGKNQ